MPAFTGTQVTGGQEAVPSLTGSLLAQAVSGVSAPNVHRRIMQHERGGNTSRLRASVRRDGNPMRDSLPVTDLVTCAKNGDNQAWDALVERYAPLIWSICRRYRLASADAEDVGQVVWLKLVNHLDHLRDPAALPAWLATTTRRECFRMLRSAGRPPAGEQVLQVVDAENIPDIQTAAAEQELLAAERHAALREAFTRLPPGCQQLLALLMADPPIPYAEISARLGIPAGSIGPNRSRCLDRLRRDPVIAALIDAEDASAPSEMHGQPML